MTPEELREWRKHIGLTQKQVAAELDITDRAYRFLEQGYTSKRAPRPTIPRYIELALIEITRRINQSEKTEALPAGALHSPAT